MRQTMILVVEDESIVAKAIQAKLTRLGYRVPTTLTSGEEAVQAAGELRPDLVLMDIVLKGAMDGIEAAEQIRDRFDIPIVYLTAYSDDATLQRVKLTAPWGYILKPFEESTLRTTIEMALYKHRTDRLLREKEEQLATVLKNVGNAVIAANARGEVVFLNEETVRMTGADESEALGKPLVALLDLIDELTGERIRALDVPALAGAPALDAVLIAKDGRRTTVELTASSVRDEQDVVTGSVVVLRNVSGQRQAEEALRASEARYRAIVEDQTELICRFDTDLTLTFVNEAFCRFFGQSSAELLGRPVLATVPMDFVNDAQNRIQALLHAPRVITLEHPVLGAGRKLRWVQYTCRPITNATGCVVEFQSVGRDVHESKEAKQALSESEEAFRNAFANAVIGKVMIAPDGTILQVNESLCRMVGYSREELLKRTWPDMIEPRFLEICFESVLELVEGRAPSRALTIQTRHKDNRSIWVHLNAVLITHASDNPTIFVDIEDITAAQEAQMAVRDSEERYRSFVENFQGIAFRANLDSTATFFHGAVEAITGYTEADFLTGAPGWEQIIFPQDLEAVQDTLARIRTESHYGTAHEYRIIHKNGEMRWIRELVRNICDDSGAPVQIQGAIYDITESKRAGETVRAAYTQLKAREAELTAAYQQLKASQDELKESQRTLSTLMSNLPGMAYRRRHDAHWTMEFVSEGGLELTGYPPASLTAGRAVSYRALIHPEDREAVQHKIDDALQAGIPYYLVYRIVAAGDQEKWVWEQGRSAPGADCSQITLEGFVSDITQRIRVEEALRQSEELYHSIFDTAPNVILSIDNDGGILDCNSRVRQVFGYEPVEIIGSPIEQLLDPTAKDKALLCLAQLRALGSELNKELTMLTKDGRLLDISVNSSTLRDASGRVSRIICILEDITDRKRAGQELARLATAIEQTADAVLISNARGIIQYVNPTLERTTGYTAQELVGQHVKALKSDTLDTAYYANLWGAVVRGEVWSGRIISRKKDGAAIEEDTTVSPVRDESGAIVNYVAVKRDVTREAQLEDRLRESQKLEAIGTLAGGIAHDFNNILTPILGFTEMVRSDLPRDSMAYDNLDEVIKAGHRAKELVRQILTFSRQASNEPQAIQVHLILKEVLKLLRASIPSTIEIRERIETKQDVIFADPTQIHQVILNLCTNAYHAMELTGGTLEVASRVVCADKYLAQTYPNLKDGRYYVVLVVSDTGHGMNEATRQRIFDPFFTTKGKNKGTGLGLSTVHGIISELEGEIEVDSEPDRGATFRIYLPLFDVPIADAPVVMESFPKGKGESILLIDDEEMNLSLGKQMIARLGYRVTSISKSLEALQLFSKDPDRFQLVITDQTMPKMTGIQLAAKIAELRPDLSIIIATGFSEVLTQDSIKSLPVRQIVQKPYTRREIAVAIRNALGHSGDPTP